MVLLPSEVFDLTLFGITHPSLGVLLFPPCEGWGSVADGFNVVCKPTVNCFSAQDFLLRLEFLNLGFDDCKLVLDFHGIVSLIERIALLLSILEYGHR